MLIQTHWHLHEPKQIRCTRLLVLDDNGNPCVVAVDDGNGIWAVRRGDPQFDDVLKNFGIKDTIIETKVISDFHAQNYYRPNIDQ